MNIFILGSNGMLGRYINKYLSNNTEHTIILIDRSKFDVINDNINILQQILIQNSIIINCIGIIPHTNIIDTKQFIRINSIFPNQLSILCNLLNIKLIHITTDCVFSGKKGNYNELDIHDETNIYGISKSLGEPNNCTVIRTSIIGEEINHKYSLLEWVKSNKNKTVNGYINHYWNGITCFQLSKIIKYIIDNNIYWIGIKHIFSPTPISKFNLIKLINDIYKLNITINKYDTNISIDKTLSSIYSLNNDLNIPELYTQMHELYNFNII